MPAPDFIGLTGPEYEVDIERGKIREFARAMHGPLPEFIQGHHPIVPPMFLVSAPYTWGYTLERPRGTVFEQIDHDLTVSLHGGESFHFFGDLPRAGDRLLAVAELEDVIVKQGSSGGTLTFLVMLTRYRDLDGNLKAEQRSTTVTTEETPGIGDWNPLLPDYQPDYRSLDPTVPFSEIQRVEWTELAEGKGPMPVTVGPLLIGDVARFQGVVGEDDPLHSDMQWARQHDYPSVFGLGTYQASMVTAYACHYLPASAVRSVDVRFKTLFWPGEEIRYHGLVDHLSETDKTASMRLGCENSAGESLMTVSMQFDLNPVE